MLSNDRLPSVKSRAISLYDVTPPLYVCLACESRIVIIKLKSHNSFNKLKFYFLCVWLHFFVFHLLILW